MECVCGYKYEIDWTDNEGRVIKGDEEFIYIDCHVTIREDFEDKKVYLHACPKCGTVKMTKGWF